MNHIYRLVWCKSRNALVAASELSSRRHGGVSVSPGRMKAAKLLSVALLGAGGFVHAAGAFAQSTGSAKLDDLQSLVSKYDAPVVGASAGAGMAPVAGAPVTVVRQATSVLPVGGVLPQVGKAVRSTLAAVPPAHAAAHVSTSLAGAHLGVRADRHGAHLGAGVTVHPGAVAGVVSGVTDAASGLPVAGKALSRVGSAVDTVASVLPAVHAGVGVTVHAPSAIEPMAADRRRNDALVSSRAHDLGIADGDGGGLPVQVVGSAVDTAGKLPVVGSVVTRVGQTVTAVTSGNGDVAGTVGKVVGGVVDTASKVPVAGPVVAQVGDALESVTSGGGNLTGTVGKVIGGVVDTASKVPVAGPVVAQVGDALKSVTSGGNFTGTVGKVVGGVVDTASKVPVAGPVVAQVGDALESVTSGGGNLTGTVGKVVGGVVDTASKVPVAGPVVAQVGDALKSVTSGDGDLGTTLGKVVGGVVNHGADLPVVGSTVASTGQALKTVTSGGSVGGGLEGQLGMVVGDAVNSLSRTPGVGPVVAKVGQTLEETTARIGNANGGGNGGAPGQVLGGVVDSASKLPVVGPVVGQVGDALTSATSGNGDVTGTVGDVVDGVTDATSKLPVVGPVVGQVGDALTSVTSGGGSGTGAVGQVVDGVADTASQLPVLGPVVGQVGQALTSATSGAGAAGVSPLAAPVVPAPGSAPTGLIIGNGGLVGTATQLLGSTEDALFNNSDPDGYISNGSLKVSNANFTQGYSTVNLLGLPVVNSTPVGTVLTTTDGVALGGTGTNSHLTLIGGVTSGNYISNINNGAAGGLLGLVLPNGAPAWASTCLNVLGIVQEKCWAVNAAQDYQVLVGDGASANGSKEVVIGTNASHTLPTVDANTAFPGNGTNDPNDPSGVPTADYEARLGHSVVIGDDASGTANAQTILGAEATASAANSVALGYKSAADRGAQTGYAAYGLSAPQNSAGEVSIGAPGAERQITNVAAGGADTDAVNVAQLKGVAATADNSVQYDSASHTLVTLAGPASSDGGATGGTTITNLHQGALGAASTDAVNGSQLFATNMSLAKYMGGTTNFDPATNTWTAPTFSITSVASDGSTTKNDYDNVTDAFAAVDGSVNTLNSRIKNIDETGSKYFQAHSTGAAAAAQGADSVAVGPASVAGGDGSTAMGKGATASADDAVAIGTGAVARNGSAVSIGAGNTADGDGAVAMGDPNTATGQGAVALGYDNQATGQGAVALGSTAVADGASAVALGDSANASADNALAFGAGATASMANSIALGAGSSTVVGALSGYTAYGLTAAQTSAGELNVGNRQITGVAAGSADDDAVNVAQLKAVDQKADSTDKLAVKYDADSSGNATNTVTLTGDGSGAPVLITNLAAGAESATSTDAVNGSQLWHWTQDTTNQYSNYSLYQDIQNIKPGGGGSVKYFNVNSTGPDSSATGSDSVAIGPSAKSGGKGSVAVGNGASASADNSVAIGSGSVADRANTVSVGSAGNERQITHVAAGTAATDAVNVGQLDSAIDTTTKGTVRYDTNTDGSIDYGSVTLGNGTGDTTVHNVAAGTAATDAANVGQVQQAADWAKSYTDQRFDQLSGQLDRIGHRADAGVAAAMATAGLPQAYEPGRSMAAFSAGTFRGESSIAIGISTISEGGRWVYKVAGSADTRGDAGVSIGAGMQW
jgi:autotransporter adhesin